jgi:GDP-4-dehydro-6-deoxy-D-mannose reductase
LESLGWEVTGTARRAQERLLACDLNDAECLAAIISQAMPDVIFHLASLTPAAAPKATAGHFLQVNVSGTLNLLEAARKIVPQARVILVTSSAMYGIAEAHDGVIHEESALRPVNAYGVSKATQH